MIITGCQRTGTKTIAQIFDLPHEQQFNAITTKPPPFPQPEVSWMAAPFLFQVQKNHSVIHLVRNPLDILNSLMGIEFFDPTTTSGRVHKKYRDFTYKHLPALYTQQCPMSKAIYYILHWNILIEQYAVATIRIEDIKTKVKLNSRKRANLTIKDLPHGNLRNEFERCIAAYKK